MPTHTLTLTYASGSEQLRTPVAMTADAEDNRDIAMAAGAGPTEVALVIDISQLKSIYIQTDVAGTIKTNSSGAPQETITLAAGGVWQWNYLSGITLPFAGDITKIFITSTDAANGTFKIRCLIDATV